MSCRDGCSLWSRGSWLGGSLVSALSFVASCTRWIGPCCSFRVPLFLFSVWGHSYHGTKLSSCMIWDDTKLSPLALIHLFHPQLVAVTSLLGVRFGFCFVCFCFSCFLFFVWGGFCLCFCLLGFGLFSGWSWQHIGLCIGPPPVTFAATLQERPTHAFVK